MQALLTFPSPSPPSTEEETSVHALNHGKSVPSKSNIIFLPYTLEPCHCHLEHLSLSLLKKPLK